MPLPTRSFVAALVVALAVPEVAHARREPSVSEPAAPMPVAPAAATPSAVSPVAAAPVAAPAPAPMGPVADPWAAPPPPAPVASSVPPPRLVAPPPPRPSHGDGKDLIAIGLSTFGAFYFFTSLAGAVIIDNTRDRKYDEYGEAKPTDTKRLNYGRALLVPVAGPFIGIRYTDSAKERWGAALTGSVQVAGVIMTAVGLIRNARYRRAQRFGVGAGMAAGGGVVSLSGRF
jgi:hypothetical protein